MMPPLGIVWPNALGFQLLRRARDPNRVFIVGAGLTRLIRTSHIHEPESPTPDYFARVYII